MKKTNATRILDKMDIKYEIREYEVDEDDLSAGNAALKLGIPLEQVFKTLVARGDKTGVLMACIPGIGELDLKQLAKESGNKKVEMVAMKEIQPLTGYIRGGVSPVVAKKQYPLYLDKSALNFTFISVSAGVRGLQMLIDPKDLVRAINAAPVPNLHNGS